MRWFVLIFAAALVSACSLLVHFDPESQPCDTGGECLPGYFCSDAGLCKATDGGAGLDGGGTDASTCTLNETSCGDRTDNDCDGKTDCEDTDCGGKGCDDRNPCTTGESCSGGTCSNGNAVVCTTMNSCQQPMGTCDPNMGGCVFTTRPDGFLCGDAGPSARCCTGTCVDTTTNPGNCGGCGLACTTGQTCQSLELSGCIATEPAKTSGRCTCGTGIPCPGGQSCSNGRCAPVASSQCAPGQMMADAGVCAPYCRY